MQEKVAKVMMVAIACGWDQETNRMFQKLGDDFIAFFVPNPAGFYVTDNLGPSQELLILERQIGEGFWGNCGAVILESPTQAFWVEELETAKHLLDHASEVMVVLIFQHDSLTLLRVERDPLCKSRHLVVPQYISSATHIWRAVVETTRERLSELALHVAVAA